ncbi:MAG: MBL fold metallo-hydrolase [bacterium]|nr:MBL fold metallo-hydrolase [bacterium]
MSDLVRVKFWGVRGSVPAPITASYVEKKIHDALQSYSGGKERDVGRFVERLSHVKPFTYGGNTSCVEVRYGDSIFILDMGTGIRPLGNSLFPEMFKKGGLKIHFFLSHVHWDHIQGLPFFAPLYVNKQTGIKNEWNFYGGTNWQKTAEVCLRGQMDPPTFPVSWQEIEKITYQIFFGNLYDQLEIQFDGGIRISFGKLDHPQETYGIRMDFPNGVVIAYTTDNEPRDPSFPDTRLKKLADGADLWITDCQYSRGQYNGEKGEGGVPRHGWGHSYPEAVAITAVQARVKQAVLFHHDPASSDERIFAMEEHTQSLINEAGGGSKVTAAYEELEIVL